MIFDQLIWQSDRMLLNNLVFRLEHYRSENWDGGDHFSFYKIKSLVDEYEHYLKRRADFSPKHIIELGTYDGGSIVFWFELFKPQKHIGIDLEDRKDSPYFRKYLEENDLIGKITTYWNTDQTDKTTLREIVSDELNGYLDCVIDDASHLYQPTKTSFETLFPLMAPGGLYIIEDWAWGHWPQFITPDHIWASQIPPTRLVNELVEATGTSKLISNITVYQGFISVERGPKKITDPVNFLLQNYIIKKEY
jgi:cephalosporin hydroxylase